MLQYCIRDENESCVTCGWCCGSGDSGHCLLLGPSLGDRFARHKRLLLPRSSPIHALHLGIHCSSARCGVLVGLPSLQPFKMRCRLNPRQSRKQSPHEEDHPVGRCLCGRRSKRLASAIPCMPANRQPVRYALDSEILKPAQNVEAA